MEGETTQFYTSHILNVMVPTVSNSKDVQYEWAFFLYSFLKLGSSVCFLEALVSGLPRDTTNSPEVADIFSRAKNGTTIHIEGITLMSSPDRQKYGRAA